MRIAAALAIALASAQAWPGELQVIDDFEHGVGGWYLVEGEKPQGAGPLCLMSASPEAKVGRGAARLRYAPCPNTWTHMQLNLSTQDWIANDCDRVSFWLKGDGSGETFNLMFGNYEIKPALCFVFSVKLDFTDWRRFVVPFNDFEPKGQMAAHLGPLALAQFNVRGTTKPVDLLIDELVVLPADRGGPARKLFPLTLRSTGGWAPTMPAKPLRVDHLNGLPPGVELSGYIHGIVNHPDLHAPVVFLADYPEDGDFGVKIAETSGYGGSRLIIKIDGGEKLRRDFPGKTQTSLTDYAGYYGVPVPRGKHTITVDNDGADWYHVEAYSFGNYGTAMAHLRREDGRLEAKLYDDDGAPMRNVAVDAAVADAPVPLSRQADGSWASDCLWGRFPSGRYPITVTARRGNDSLWSTTFLAALSATRLRPLKTALVAGENVALDVLYLSDSDAPMDGAHLSVTVDGRTVVAAGRGEGVYRATLGKLPSGIYHAPAQVQGGRSFDIPFIVYDPTARAIEQQGLVRLAGGRFMTADGKPFTPWGYATIGLFAPDLESAVGLAGPNLWCRASDEAVLNWIGLLAACGVNCVRFGVTVDAHGICGDTGGHADPFIVERLHHFLDLIAPLGVRALPVLWWGHYRNFGYEGIPAYDAIIDKQADWFTKPEALKLQEQYVREMVAPFRDDPRIFAWEVMNETYRAGDDINASIRWADEIAATIRAASPGHLVTISACEATPGPELEWIRGSSVDFFNSHAYPSYPDYDLYRKIAGDSSREMGNYAAVMTLCDRMGEKCSLLGETGNDRTLEADYPEVRALITRDCLWLSFLNGSPGGISWDAIADPREFIVLSDVARGVDWSKFKPAVPPVAVSVIDADAALPVLAKYTWWSLQNGVPIVFLGPGRRAIPGQDVLNNERFEPPVNLPDAPVSVSAGFQAASMQSRDGRVFIAYIRNLAGPTRINVRLRKPAPLTIHVRGPKTGTIQVWDLDLLAIVCDISAKPDMRLDLGTTAHDFCLTLRP
jgi:hypothetical protein